MATKVIARKHHYVPQGYLAAFTATGMKSGQFYVHDVQNGKSFRTSPANVAAERDFNRVDIEGHSPDSVENSLSRFEDEAVTAIRGVIEAKNFPNGSDCNLILNFLCLIAVRNPRRRRLFNQARENSLRMIADMLVSDKKLWEGHVRRAEESGEKLPEVSFEEFKSFVERGEYDYVFHPQGNLDVEFNAIDKVLPLLGQRTWSVLVAPPAGPEFICSDHPVTLNWKPGRKGPIGYGRPQTEVFFPLSRRVGFYGVYEDALKPVVNCRPLNVAIMNRRVANNAERHVYSALEEFSVWRQGEIQTVECRV